MIQLVAADLRRDRSSCHSNLFPRAKINRAGHFLSLVGCVPVNGRMSVQDKVNSLSPARLTRLTTTRPNGPNLE